MRYLTFSSLLLFLVACSESAPVSENDSAAGAAEGSAFERSTDPRVMRLRDDLDLLREGDAISEMRELGLEFEDVAGVESFLLKARMFGLRGELSKAHPLIEAARAAAPRDPRVYATTAELYAAAGQFDTATAWIKDGLRLCGATPEIQRAQGLMFICSSEPGSAERGLAKLKAAMLEDPDLPFTKRPLGQAYLLVARHELAGGLKDQALADIKSSLSYDPSETEAWHFLAEVWSARNEHEKAIGVLEHLIELDRPLQAELGLTHKKAGTQSLLAVDRPAAVEHFLAARELGLTDEELGFGFQVLIDESAKEIELGLAKLRDSELPAARAHLERAVACDPKSLAARNHLAVVQFKMSDLVSAADNWRTVLLEAAELGVKLPDPVHINLAKALLRLNDEEGALLALKDYLLEEPFGDFIDETRELVTSMQRE